MADSDPKIQLKYLQFVQAAVLHAAIAFSRVYGYAKDNSGPLKPTVETVQSTVKAVVDPAYGKFHDVPIKILKFVDRNIDESVIVLDKVSTQAVSEARSVYAKYEPVAEEYAVAAWQSLNRLPLFHRVANSVIVPTAAYCSDKYNEKVMSMAGKGFRVASYLPLVPTEKIARVFSTQGHREVSAPTTN